MHDLVDYIIQSFKRLCKLNKQLDKINKKYFSKETMPKQELYFKRRRIKS